MNNGKNPNLFKNQIKNLFDPVLNHSYQQNSIDISNGSLKNLLTITKNNITKSSSNIFNSISALIHGNYLSQVRDSWLVNKNSTESSKNENGESICAVSKPAYSSDCKNENKTLQDCYTTNDCSCENKNNTSQGCLEENNCRENKKCSKDKKDCSCENKNKTSQGCLEENNCNEDKKEYICNKKHRKNNSYGNIKNKCSLDNECETNTSCQLKNNICADKCKINYQTKCLSDEDSQTPCTNSCSCNDKQNEHCEFSECESSSVPVKKVSAFDSIKLKNDRSCSYYC